MATHESLEDLIKALTPELQREAEDFIRFLLEKPLWELPAKRRLPASSAGGE